ncbi:MAG: hypothetical protein M3Z37_04370 [Candidatus Eremiobacteraeota bacterium]|nr:hypothetical protein [Candidatus Eremiobacteraeota bacterium]
MDDNRDLKTQAQQAAREVGGKAKGLLREQMDQRFGAFGDQLKGAAGEIRTAGEHLRTRGSETAANLADGLAERTERVAQYLQTTDPQRLMDDVENFARRQPWVIAGAGVLLGLAASRTLKAARTKRFAERYGTAGGYQSRYDGDYGYVTGREYGYARAGEAEFGGAPPPTTGPDESLTPYGSP